MKEEKSPQKLASARSVFTIYISYARKHGWLLIWSILGTLVIEIAALAQPLYLRQFFNIIAGSKPTPQTGEELLVVIVFIAFCAIIERLARQMMLWAVSSFDGQIMHELINHAFEYLIGHSYDFFSSNFGGSLTHKVNKFSRSFETISDSLILNFLPTALYVLGAVGILFSRNHVLGLTLLIWTIAFISVQEWIVNRMRPLRKERAEAETHQTGAIADAISNHNTIELFSGGHYENERLRRISNEWLSKTLRLWFFDNHMWGIIGILMIGINIALLYGAMIYWEQGLLTVGDFILIQSYLIGTFNNVMGINRQLRGFYDALADATEMMEILETPHEIANKIGAKSISISEGTIAFNQVTFSFNDRSVLENLTITLQGGEKIAFVGPSGAGKSTITKLLLRLYNIQKGRIEIDAQDIVEVTQESLRNAIAFVPQEPILFHRTLMENIRYGKRDATDAEVIEAAKQAHCHEFISTFPEGYNTYVGERGVRLSGGERQRVAIARALLKNAPILVLDEATSSLDSESEALIQDALATLMQKKTVLVIAHRLSTIMKMDRIVVIEGGHIVAQGTHAELIQQDGLYKKLWNIQAGGFLLSEDVALEEEPEEELEEEFASDEK